MFLRSRTIVLAALGLLVPRVTQAAELDGAALGIAWSLPFVGMLLSIALLPLLAFKLWVKHYGKIAVGWSLLTVLPLAFVFDSGLAAATMWHTLATEYVPFIIFVGTLYVVSGGIYVRGNLHGSPLLNTALLAIGGVLASFMGTTGAGMLLIRPLLRANDNRRYRVHTVVFFIFIVANIGGSLTPLGDPPLFLGFLRGVSFFWPLQHLWPATLLLMVALLAIYFVMDVVLYRRDVALGLKKDPTPDSPIRIEGKRNFVLLAVAVLAVLASGLWKPGIEFSVFGVALPLQGLLRDALFLAIGATSLAITKKETHRANEFGWHPIQEVAKLFFGIFITMAPVLAMLKAGSAGAFAGFVALVTDSAGQPINTMYFWLAGGLSSFLDNAPTYLVFFTLAGGDPQQLMTQLAPTLTAISMGAVFMGANTYIGNAPNFMVKAIAEERGVRMPSFFGYMLWSGLILLPLFALVTLLMLL